MNYPLLKTFAHRCAAPVSVPHVSLKARGFTLVELLLSMTILSVLMLVVVNVIGVVQRQWVQSNSRVTAFRESRMALDVIARNLSQATLNTYWTNATDPLGVDAANQERNKAKNYIRQSELQFCSGRTTGLLTAAAGNNSSYPGHGVFFQAPLGTTRLVSANGGPLNTENLVNLLCARGYFVYWGDDAPFRPQFLNNVPTVQPRLRYRLMEYNPTAESNRIYYDAFSGGSLANRKPITDPSRSKTWFQDALVSMAQAGETGANRGFTRPVADNIIALVLSPQLSEVQAGPQPESIAPLYEYDSVLTNSPGAPGPSPTSPQGTQHLLPPLMKVTMVALDGPAGERLAENGNQDQQQRLAGVLGPLFQNATQYNTPNSTYNQDLRTLQDFLVREQLNFRVFTTTVIMKQARWSN